MAGSARRGGCWEPHITSSNLTMRRNRFLAHAGIATLLELMKASPMKTSLQWFPLEPEVTTPLPGSRVRPCPLPTLEVQSGPRTGCSELQPSRCRQQELVTATPKPGPGYCHIIVARLECRVYQKSHRCRAAQPSEGPTKLENTRGTLEFLAIRVHFTFGHLLKKLFLVLSFLMCQHILS